MKKIIDAQTIIQNKKIDGWLLYDFRNSNSIAHEFLGIPPQTLLTRRFFYWIPAIGDPIAIMHAIEPHTLAHLPGKKFFYSSRSTLEELLKNILHAKSTIAMEYSPMGAIPTASKVDAGTYEFIKGMGPTIVSSAPFLSFFTCVWGKREYDLHKKAAAALEQTVSSTWNFIANRLKNNSPLTEYDVQQHMLSEIHAQGCLVDGNLICGVNQNSADPHYGPTSQTALPIHKGDLILIDLWCKENTPNSVYADITRVAVAGKPTAKQIEIFQIVRNAQKTATDFVQKQIETKQPVTGAEVDTVCRNIIEKAGYGKYFTHRTGHNIHEEDHGPGPNIDGFETLDERPLIPRTCFSIEPGIYLQGEFGIRLEYDIYIHENNTTEITGGIQEELFILRDI
jgi:Xaa-Pro dipeptidase